MSLTHTHSLALSLSAPRSYGSRKGKLSNFQFNMSNLHKYKVSIHIIKSFWSSLFTHIWTFVVLSSIPYSRLLTRSPPLGSVLVQCLQFILYATLDTIITFQNCYGDEIRFCFCLLSEEFERIHQTLMTQIYEKLEIEREKRKN